MTSRVQIIWTQDGLSLVELSIVILLLSFLLLLSIPRFGTVLVGQRLNSTGHLITGMVRYLYEQSTAKKRVYRLNYHLKDGELWVTFPNDDGEFIEDQSSTFTLRRKLPTGIQFEDIVTPVEKVKEAQAYTQFFPTGLVDRTIVHLRADDGTQLSVLIHPLSGRVSIEPGYRELEVVQAK
jgi:competence protein ComGC